MPFHNKIVQICRWFKTAISELPRWNFLICLCLKYSSLNSECIVSFPSCEFVRFSNNPKNALQYTYFTLRFSNKQRWRGGKGLTATVKLCTAHACYTSHCYVSRHRYISQEGNFQWIFYTYVLGYYKVYPSHFFTGCPKTYEDSAW